MKETIGKIIREQRKSKSLTIKELAHELGIHEISLANYENGKTLPRIDILSKISSFFEIDYDDLYQKLEKERIKRGN